MNATPCEGCRFAEWKRTANGRLHPSRDGKCLWVMEAKITLPASIGNYDTNNIMRSVLKPHYIERGRWPTGACAVREEEGE